VDIGASFAYKEGTARGAISHRGRTQMAKKTKKTTKRLKKVKKLEKTLPLLMPGSAYLPLNK